MFNHDLGYKEAKALFLVLQNTGCFKDRSIEVFVPSTCFDWKNISVVSSLTKFDIEYITTKVIKGRVVAEFLALNAVEGEEQWNLEFPDENLALIECREWKLLFQWSCEQQRCRIGSDSCHARKRNYPYGKEIRF